MKKYTLEIYWEFPGNLPLQKLILEKISGETDFAGSLLNRVISVLGQFAFLPCSHAWHALVHAVTAFVLTRSHV